VIQPPPLVLPTPTPTPVPDVEKVFFGTSGTSYGAFGGLGQMGQIRKLSADAAVRAVRQAWDSGGERTLGWVAFVRPKVLPWLHFPAVSVAA
jgi:hypothetical protein